MGEFAPFLIPGAFGLLIVIAQQAVARRKNTGDGQLGFIAVLQAERATADGRADKAEARAERADRRARRWEDHAWRLHTIIQRAGMEPPSWPTDEQSKVSTP